MKQGAGDMQPDKPVNGILPEAVGRVGDAAQRFGGGQQRRDRKHAERVYRLAARGRPQPRKAETQARRDTRRAKKWRRSQRRQV